MPAALPGRHRPGSVAGVIGRLITAVLMLAVMVAGFMVSLVVFAVALLVGVAVFAWIWWKMRRALRDATAIPGAQGPGDPPGRADSEVIEGQVLSGEWKDPPPPPGSTPGR